MDKYPIFALNDNTFLFNVNEIEGVQYKVEFSSAAHYLSGDLIHIDLYELSFSRITDNQNDIGFELAISHKIRNSIFFIIKQYLSNHKCILVFVCDSSDNKENARIRLFYRWYKLQQDKNYLLEVNSFIITEDGLEYFTGILGHADDTDFPLLVADLQNPEILSDK